MLYICEGRTESIQHADVGAGALGSVGLHPCYPRPMTDLTMLRLLGNITSQRLAVVVIVHTMEIPYVSGDSLV